MALCNAELSGKTNLPPFYALRSTPLLSLYSGDTNQRLFYALTILMFTNFSKDYDHGWLSEILLPVKPRKQNRRTCSCSLAFSAVPEMASQSKLTLEASSWGRKHIAFLSFDLVKFKLFWRNAAIVSRAIDQPRSYC